VYGFSGTGRKNKAMIFFNIRPKTFHLFGVPFEKQRENKDNPKNQIKYAF
jgi:hypothetical protein